jgi:hypothetical protein
MSWFDLVVDVEIVCGENFDRGDGLASQRFGWVHSDDLQSKPWWSSLSHIRQACFLVFNCILFLQCFSLCNF